MFFFLHQDSSTKISILEYLLFETGVVDSWWNIFYLKILPSALVKFWDPKESYFFRGFWLCSFKSTQNLKLQQCPPKDQVKVLLLGSSSLTVKPSQIPPKFGNSRSRFHLTDFAGKFTVQEQPAAIAPTSISNGSGRPLNLQLLFEQIGEYLLS
jgi:hypothetical protein